MAMSVRRHNHHSLLGVGILHLLLLVVSQLPLSWTLHVRPTINRAPATTRPSATKTRLFATPHSNDQDRRTFLTTSAAALATLTTNPLPAHAGLIQFPCTRPLKNRYHFMRAGPSDLEADGIYSTNALFLTNRENALQTNPEASRIIRQACAILKANPNFPTVAYHSLAANGMDTADVLATELHISRDRLLPEFTYLDPRGIGLWDSGSLAEVQPAIMALDYYEGGKFGTGGRPPANEDGTANEVLGDQFVRLRQFLSLQESRTSGENILIIFPDGTGPALLSAMIAGIPFNEVHCLDYKPGEVRLDISRESILELYQQRKDDPEYWQKLEEGKEKLAALRRQEGDVVSFKDQLRDQERADLDSDFAMVKQKERDAEAIKVQERQAARQLQLEREEARREEARQLALEKEQALAAKKAEREQAKRDKAAALQEQAARAAAAKPPQENQEMDVPVMAAVGLGVIGIGALAALGGDESDDETAVLDTPKEPTPSVVVGANGTAAVAFAPAVEDEALPVLELPTPSPSGGSRERPATATPEISVDESVNVDEPVVKLEKEMEEPEMADDKEISSVPTSSDPFMKKDKDDKPETPKPTSAVDDELVELETAQDLLFGALEDSLPPPKVTEEEPDPVDQELGRLEAAQEAMNGYLDMDDGANDWLQVLSEIRDEPDEEADRVNGEGRGYDL